MAANVVNKRGRLFDVKTLKWTWELARDIPSDPHQGVEVIRAILEHLRREAWGEQELFAVHMSLEEAVMNAIKHGNRHDEQKAVRVSAKCNAEYLYVRIADQGSGFDPRLVPDCTAEENLERECGRGLMLMRCYMDDVRYNRRGNTVELFKRKN